MAYEDESEYERQARLTPDRVRKILEDLEKRNEVKVGDTFLVRIPKIEGKIFIRKVDERTTYVDYIYSRWYDPASHQTRNRRMIIGRYYRLFPGAMVPNQQYYKYFDRETGELIKKEEDAEGTEGSMETWEETDDEENRMETEEAEEENQVDQKMKQAIQDVLEREGMIPKAGGQWMRKAEDRDDDAETGQEDFDEEAEETDEEERERWENLKRKKRIRILLDILTSIRSVVKEQARKRPDEVMNRFQVKKINPILEEIQELVKGRGLEDLLEVVQEPRAVEKKGEMVLEGMSYSDVEILLEYYNSVIWYTQSEIKG